MSSEFLLCTDLERFLLHTPNERRRSQEKRSCDYSLLDKPSPMSATTDAPQMSATITDLCSEPLFLNAYLSDEEEHSLADTDGMSFSSGISSDTANSVRDEDMADDLDVTLPDLLTEECTFAKQECEHAQAVKLVAVGRPRVIQTMISSHSQSLGTSKHHSRAVSRTSSSGSSLPATPLLNQGLLTPMSACTPLTPETPSFVFRFDTHDSPTQNERHKAPVECHIPFLEEYRPRPLQVAKRSGSLSVVPMTAPPTYSYFPSSYANKPKTIQRSAGDFGSMMSLPPFPKDEITHTVKTSKWPFALRKDSFGAVHHRRELSKVRRVESMAALNRP